MLDICGWVPQGTTAVVLSVHGAGVGSFECASAYKRVMSLSFAGRSNLAAAARSSRPDLYGTNVAYLHHSRRHCLSRVCYLHTSGAGRAAAGEQQRVVCIMCWCIVFGAHQASCVLGRACDRHSCGQNCLSVRAVAVPAGMQVALCAAQPSSTQIAAAQHAMRCGFKAACNQADKAGALCMRSRFN